MEEISSPSASDRKDETVEDKAIFTKEQQLRLLALLEQPDSQHSTHQLNQLTTPPPSAGKFSLTFPQCHWLLDSGATDHVCFNLKLFHTYKRIKPILVHLPNRQTIQAHFSGTVIFSPDFYLTNVLFLPQFSCNLISISKLTATLSCKLTFSAHKCEIQDLISLKMIGVADELHGLYAIKISAPDRSALSSTPLPSTTSSTVCHSYTHFSISELWHSRLGHPSFDKVHVIKKLDPTVECLNIHTSCDVCHYAKMKKLSFPSSTNTSYSAYDLIHVDIWGPFGMPSILGHKYFLTIVDDFSRYTWVFCMKTKAEKRPALITFIKLIQTQFHKTVKTIRSDNGPEFNITDFFNKNGIHHQTSCVETPQQNVVVERKHQSILNIARSLLFQSHLPICFWNYAITHDVFILNRLPTTTLKNLTPFEALNNQVPNYSELRVFDSLCFATTLSAHRSKFDKRTRKCIFVGYQRGTKGYLLYDLHNREIFLSRHVEFHEHIFPFSMPQSPPISSSSSPSSPLPNWDFFDTPYSILTPVEPSPTSQSPPSISVHPPLSKNIYVSESHVSLPIPLNSRPSGS